MSRMLVETGVVRLVSQWCPAIEEVVTLQVSGSVFGDLINGNVVECRRVNCHAKNTSYCWLGKHVQTNYRRVALAVESVNARRFGQKGKRAGGGKG